MAFGMEHYMHHKYHAHAEAAAPAAAEAPAVESPSPGRGSPPAAAAALGEPLPANADELAEEIKSLRHEIATLRQGIASPPRRRGEEVMRDVLGIRAACLEESSAGIASSRFRAGAA